jgi:hypothetical protein
MAETAQVFINRRMELPILKIKCGLSVQWNISHKMENSSGTCYMGVKPENIMVSKTSQTQSDKYCIFPLM